MILLRSHSIKGSEIPSRSRHAVEEDFVLFHDRNDVFVFGIGYKLGG